MKYIVNPLVIIVSKVHCKSSSKLRSHHTAIDCLWLSTHRHLASSIMSSTGMFANPFGSYNSLSGRSCCVKQETGLILLSIK